MANQQQLHDRKGVTIQKGDRVILEGVVMETFEGDPSNDNLNLVVRIQAPRGSHIPNVVCNNLAVEKCDTSEGGSRQPATAGAGSNR